MTARLTASAATPQDQWMADDIKSMQLYPRAERIYADLRAEGFEDDAPVPVEILNRFDQLHYHGTEALDTAITACGITVADHLLEVGSGWGGCARYLAATSGAHVTAVELQVDYDKVARDLTARAGLTGQITHVNADFLTMEFAAGAFSHAVSWLALFHIPNRPSYLSRLNAAIAPGGMLFAEDLYAKGPPADPQDFARHLFPNSLVDLADYRSSLRDAGFELVQLDDMTADWAAFTADRLAAFRATRADYEARHGPEGYAVIETFYDKMAGYFADGSVGGLRMAAHRV